MGTRKRVLLADGGILTLLGVVTAPTSEGLTGPIRRADICGRPRRLQLVINSSCGDVAARREGRT